jgi:pimeloyl-ACP methyl ester carboxylesterase
VNEQLAEWQARGRTIPSEVGDIFVVDLPAVDAGPDEPLFILHGFPSCSADWRHIVDRFTSRRRVVLFDFVGFGLSAKPDRRYSIEVYADVATTVAEACELERVALLTHDMGDTVGGELLARDLDGTLPFSVTRRVLSNGSIYIEMAQLTNGQQLLLSLDDAPVDLISEEMFSGGLAETFSAVHPAGAEELALQWAALAYNDGHRMLPRTIRYIEDRRANEARYTGAIEKHPSPLGVVWGMLDPVAVAPMVDRLISARPGTPVVRLNDVGHYPMVEAPGDFATAVESLLASGAD